MGQFKMFSQFALSGLLLASRVDSQAVTISIPGALPSGSSQIVDHSFPSLAVEVASFADYAGNTSDPNLFSRNLIDTISNKTGKPIVIRVGGTSGDHDYYNSSQNVSVLPPPTKDPNNPLYGITLGPSYYEGFKSFPGTNFTFMVPMAFSNATATPNAISQAKLAVSNIGLSHLDSLEIGNEPDLYYHQGVKGKAYDEATYVRQWLEHAININGNITGLPKDIYQALTLSSGYNFSQWNQSAAFTDGINSNGNVKSVSFHHYQTFLSANFRLGSSLMNHNAIVNGLSQFSGPISFLQNNDDTIPFHLGEVGSALNPEHLYAEILGMYGTALWTVDYMLYAMSMNMSRVHMQQGTGFGYAAWQPVPRNGTEQYAPHVRAPYYGIAFVADFIGTATNVRIKNIDLQNQELSAYAGYQSGVLAKAAVINLVEWNATETTTRPVQTLTLDVPKTVASVKVQRLTGPGASSYDNVTWGGVEWTYASMGRGVQVVNDTQTVNVTNGVVGLSVNASEAILVTMISS